MKAAYVLINSDVGKDDSIIALLKNIDVVKEAHGAFGSYDIIVRLEDSDEVHLQQEMEKKIRKIQQIRATLTLPIKGNEGFRKTTKEENEILGRSMAQSFVGIHCMQNDLNDISLSLKKIPEVIECSPVSGSFELICKIAAPSYNEISEIVSKKIRKIPNIKSTVTLNVVAKQGFVK